MTTIAEGTNVMKKISKYTPIILALSLIGISNSCLPNDLADYRKPGKTDVNTEIIGAIDDNGDGLKTKICRYQYNMPAVPINIRHSIVLGGVCYDANKDNRSKISSIYGAQYSEKENKWEPYYVNTDDEKILKPVSKVVEIKSKNSSGFYRLTDDVTGDENTRSRNISYCLFHETEALCGAGQVMNLAHPNSNILPYTLEILKSTYFINSDTSKSPSGN